MAVSSFFFNRKFHRYCVYAALNNFTHIFRSLLESIGVIKKMKEILPTEKEMAFLLYCSFPQNAFSDSNL